MFTQADVERYKNEKVIRHCIMGSNLKIWL
jgi:hypothetical protein